MDKMATVERADLFFEDGVRRIDYVLVWNESDESNSSYDAVQKRCVFEENLERDGLQLERSQVADLHATKIHVPLPVLQRTAEVMKLRVPLKDGPVTEDGESAVKSRLWSRFGFDLNVFPPKGRRFTEVYSAHKDHLFDGRHFSEWSTRTSIVDFVLKRARFDPHDEYAFGIERLLNERIYSAAYPLHEGDYQEGGNRRHLLATHWSSLRNVLRFQPLDYISDYFGVKVALYFAWLGFYTHMLCVASLVGVVVFIIGAATYSWNVPVQEICNGTANVTMCPICDRNCPTWDLNESCPYVQIVHFFDNYATVGYAVFMCVWNHLHLVIWRRRSARLLHHWNISEELDELPRPQYLAHLEHYARKKSKSSMKQLPWNITLPPIMLSIFTVIFLFAIALLGVLAVIVFRTFLIYSLAKVKLTASLVAAIIDTINVLILNKLFAILASKLTSMEKIRTQRGFEDSLTIKVSILQFVNYYGSIFYVAFFKGKFVGYPGSYNLIFGYRQEECSPGGCLVELCIQMGIIMIGNQLVVSLIQIIVPRLQKWWKSHRGVLRKGLDSAQLWAQDFQLVEWSTEALFVEYLQMVLQYGFVTIFVAAFPLAPLLALIANVLELRIDAQKFLQCYRRPVAQQVRSIGIWFKVMQFISYFSMFTNAAIIAFSSDFIPKVYYKFNRSPDFSLTGYINYSLSYSDYFEHSTNQTECRYRAFREPYWSHRRYQLSEDFWHILVYRMLFVLVFVCTVSFILWLLNCIPSTPQDLRDQMTEEVDRTREIQKRRLDASATAEAAAKMEKACQTEFEVG